MDILQAYRLLLRTQLRTFQGDREAQRHAAAWTRGYLSELFGQNTRDPDQTCRQIMELDEFLKCNVLQGRYDPEIKVFVARIPSDRNR
jgi:hypothetical protein